MTARVIYLIKRAEIEITARMWAALGIYAITPIQYSLLYFIDIAKGDLSSAQLSRRFSMTPQSMNELVQALMQKKLLRKMVDPAHRRILRISLTAKGKLLLEKCNTALDAMEEPLLKKLSATETNTLRNLIGKILETAKEMAMSEK
jgi:DNA-binding MarR family transcriptional regulator